MKNPFQLMKKNAEPMKNYTESDSPLTERITPDLMRHWEENYHSETIQASIELLERYVRGYGAVINIPITWVGDYCKVIEKHVYPQKN